VRDQPVSCGILRQGQNISSRWNFAEAANKPWVMRQRQTKDR